MSSAIPAPSIEVSRASEEPPVRALASYQLDGAPERPTPEIATGFQQQLQITSSDDSDEDSLVDFSESSIEDETMEPPPFGLPSSELPTGLCYDERMRFHSEVSAPTGESVHPEDPRRIYYIFKELCEAGLVRDGSKKYIPLVKKPLKEIKARMVSEDEVLLVHTPEHWDFVESTASMTPKILSQATCLHINSKIQRGVNRPLRVQGNGFHLLQSIFCLFRETLSWWRH